MADRKTRLIDLIPGAETAAALALTALVFYLHAVFFLHVGGLWRDEVNTVHLATMPTFGQVWNNLQFDSFPILIFPVVRGWVALFSDSDNALRTLGMLIGAGIFVALWINARLFGHRLPLLSLALLGCNPLFIRYADSLRAYGLGILLMLLTFGAVWRVVESARPGRVVLAMILATLSVQAIYYNSVLLFSICAAGAVTAARERDWKKAACVLGIGVPAVLSMIPYLGTVHSLHEWNSLVQFPVSLLLIWRKLSDVTGSPDPIGIWMWTLLFLGALAIIGWRLRGRRIMPNPPPGRADRVMCFAGGTLVIGTICYVVFLKALSYYTLPWYFVAYLALAAVALDAVYGAAILDHPPHARRWRLGRLALIWGFCALMLPQARTALLTRQTNLDLVAGQLNAATRTGDLVVNIRWECAISFAHYYHGPAEDMTLPPIADHRVHRYDLVLQQMNTRGAVQPVLDEVERTLREGRRVWIVGDPAVRRPGSKLPGPTADGTGTAGPHGSVFYYQVWAMQLADVLLEHATSGARVPVPVSAPVSDYENLPVSVFGGWQ